MLLSGFNFGFHCFQGVGWTTPSLLGAHLPSLSVLNGTLCCLLMGQSSATLLSQLVCLKGFLWFSTEALSSVVREKIQSEADPLRMWLF